MPAIPHQLDTEVPQRLVTCPDCDGSGVEVYGCTVYETGCGFSHDSSDERPCAECGGLGFYVGDAEPDDFTSAAWGEHSQFGAAA